jgi:cysteine-rich repeat protein
MDIPPDYEPDAAGCGNGVVDPGEECDDGNTNDNDDCTNRCLFPRCGDGVVWTTMESCDPPGSVRPCTTSCRSTGGEFCEPYCRWTGVCVPPVEACGNGSDDDCDGVTDLIVRRTGNVKVSDRGAMGTGDGAVAWTDGELAIAWRAYPGISVLTRLDDWGNRVDWDLDLGETEPRWGDGLLWNGSALGFAWEDYIDGPGHSIPRIRFLATDATGSWLSAALVLCTEETADESCRYAKAAAYPDGWAIVRQKYGVGTVLSTIAGDGSSVREDVPLGTGPGGPVCMAWTGSELAVLEGTSVGGIEGNQLVFVSPAGVVTATAEVAIGRVEYLLGCPWTSSGMSLLAGTSSGSTNVTLYAIARDGTVLREQPIAWSGIPEAAAIWTGSELGLVGSDTRSGNHEIYFQRAGADGALLGSDARLTRTPAESSAPTIAFTGDAYAVVWSDSDGIDAGPYYAVFTVCP